MFIFMQFPHVSRDIWLGEAFHLIPEHPGILNDPAEALLHVQLTTHPSRQTTAPTPTWGRLGYSRDINRTPHPIKNCTPVDLSKCVGR